MKRFCSLLVILLLLPLLRVPAAAEQDLLPAVRQYPVMGEDGAELLSLEDCEIHSWDNGGKELMIPADPSLQVLAYTDGYALVCYDAGSFSFADASGRLVVPLLFSDASPIVNGQALVKLADGPYCRLTLKK